LVSLETLEEMPADTLEIHEGDEEGVERLRRQVAVELRSSFLADKGGIYEDVVSLQLARAELARAFEYVERAKSRALVELLAHNLDVRVKLRRESDRHLVAHIERLRQECQWYYTGLTPSANEKELTASAALEQDRLRDELRDREKQLADTWVQQVRSAEYIQMLTRGRSRSNHPSHIWTTTPCW
jgi:hypothetical protein